MAAILLFASTQAGPVVLNVALTLRAKGHQLRPLSLLPAPRPARVVSLRLELAQLQQDERIIGWLLQQYAAHYLLPDACHENSLRATLDATRARLRAVAATLGAAASREVPA